MKNKSLIIISNSNIGPVQSGGDTIFLAFIKYWINKLNIILVGSQETKNIIKNNKVKANFIQTDTINRHYKATILNLIWHNIRRIPKGIIAFFNNLKTFKQSAYCYTASDFFPDFMFGLLYKKYNPTGQWLCGYYLIIPSPNSPNTPYKNQKLKNIFYYYSQKITLKLANKYADQILITSDPDKKYFPNKKVIVVQGGVDITESKTYFKSKKIIPVAKRKYDAVFQGRLHPQKGVLELVDIWKILSKKYPLAKLAIIGDGQLKNELIKKIDKNKLNKNIILFGFKTGKAKCDIFKNSKIVVHPATYDSGGMSAAEAMAWGLPGVSFDLPALKTYYPKGMLKTPRLNYQKFADNIYQLLTNQALYNKTSKEALNLINTTWDWSKRSQKIYKQIFL